MSRAQDAARVLKGVESVWRRIPREADRLYFSPLLGDLNEMTGFLLNSFKRKSPDYCRTSMIPSSRRMASLLSKNGRAYLLTSIQRCRKGVESYRKPMDETEPYNPENEESLKLNPKTTSLDLLKVDLRDPQALKERVYIHVPVPSQISKPDQGNHDEKVSITRASFSSIPQSDSASVEAPPESRLTESSKTRKIPSSRIGRVIAFGNLGLGLGLGTIAEASKRVLSTGSLSKDSIGTILLNEANAKRIVETLCRVRGAALKIGQILSIQDETLVSPELQSIFERVRKSADYMPLWQMEKVMSQELGPAWRTQYATFEDKPFAAASIGQVHSASLLESGQRVAVKIQYPGVAKSIRSDINNLLTVLNVSKLMPEGFFLDSVIKHMEAELSRECDYLYEAECCRRMRTMILSSYPNQYYVPKVIDSLSTKRVLTAELISGITLDECTSLDKETRNHIVESVMNLVLRELFIHRYMQTDPNWANFLYDSKTKRLGLLDFGATMEYTQTFVEDYFQIIDGATLCDRDKVLNYSRKVGFLTGYESSIMNEAHIESVMILGECFRSEGVYDFGKQEITRRLQDKTVVMIKNRLCPPPPEIYSLHRKMSGIFLLAAKLNAKIDGRFIWKNLKSQYLNL